MNVKCRPVEALKMTSQLKAKKNNFFKTKLMLETGKINREGNLAKTDAKAMNFAEILMGTKRHKIELATSVTSFRANRKAISHLHCKQQQFF